MLNLLLVALGGAIGSVLRYSVVLAIRPHSPGFPTGTLIVNLLGCAAIGVLGGRLHAHLTANPDSRTWALLAIGVLGGFTTFSSFALETTQLLRDGRIGLAATYILLSNLLGVAAAFGAFMLSVPRGHVS